MPNVLLTFEDLHAGDVVNGQFSSDGVTITSVNPNGSIDNQNPPMVFDTSNPTGGDHDLATNNLGNVLIFSEDGDASDPDDNASGGIFNFDFDAPTEVLSFRVLDIDHGENGTVRLFDENDNLIKTIHISPTGNNGQATVHINTDDVSRMEVELSGSGAIDGISYVTPDEPSDGLNGVVSGDNGADVIDAGYVDDPEGDMIDNNDAILPGEAPNDDIVDALGGDDTILSGAGDDEVFAGSGNDYVEGGAGDDIIYGDSNYAGPGAGGTGGRESFNWDDAPDFENNDDASGFTQNTGSVNVTFTILRETGDAETEYDTRNQLVSGIDSGDETIENNSALYSETDGEGNQADYRLDFSDAVENVQFRINDIDGDGLVRIKAFDAVGNPITVVLDGGDKLHLRDTDSVAGADTADSRGGYDDPTEADYSVLVTIPGPVSRIVIEHDQDGGNNSGVNVTDIFFDAPTVVDNGIDGNDHLEGGDGNDTIFGEGGDDRLEGQAGNDTLDGGDGNDVILGGSGNDTAEGGAGNDEIWMGSGDDVVNAGSGNDWVHGQSGDDTLNGEEGDDMLFGEDGDDILTGGDGADMIKGGNDRDTIIGGNDGDNVDGGTGGDDYDILDLRGEGPFRVVNETVDADGDSTSGTIQFLDGDGNVTGSLQFTEIEEILGTPVNDDPDANDDVVTVNEDETVLISPLGNDTDPNGDPLTITAFTQPSNGTLVDNGDGTFSYTSNQDYNGPDSFGYTVSDGNGRFDTATVNITVDPVNDAPDAVNDQDTTAEEQPITLDVLANDTDVDGDTLTVTGATVPADQGTVQIVGNQVVFTPAENFNGVATISYSIEDGNGGTDTAIHEVNVTPVNDDPVAVDDAADTLEDTPVTFDLIGNDTDVDGDPLTIGTVSVPADQGTVVDNGDGTVTFTPAPDFNGPATITYTVVDGQGGEDEGQAVVNVGSVNDGPDAVDDTDTTDEDTPITVDLIANDTDPEGDTLTVTGASVPADQGTLVDNGDGTVTFTPAPNFNGEATISYSITDGNGGTDSAEHVITVNPVNDDPVAVDDLETTDEDVAIDIDLIANDTDVDGDPLTIGTVSVPADQGTVVDNGDGTVTFTPAPNFNGPATITYTVVDGQGGEDTGQAVVSVGAVNDAPIANDDTDTTLEDTPITVDLIGNDVDPDGDTLTVISATVPADQGTLVDNGDGTVTFTPAPDFNGEATISYEISDGNGGTDTGLHVITVTPDGDAPVTVDDVAETPEDTPITIDVLENDSDPDGDPLIISSVSVPPAQGTVEIVGNEIVFTPAPDFNGPATITYTAQDPDGNETPGTVNVTVTPVNDDPVANDDDVTVDEDGTVLISPLGNDTDVDGDTLTVQSIDTQPTNGTLTDNGDGTFTYEPDPGFNGDDSFTYTVTDGNGGTDMATVNITVNSVNDGPDAVDDNQNGTIVAPVIVNVIGNDTDPDGDALTVTGFTQPAAGGVVTDNGDGTLTFTPDGTVDGEITFDYTITDGNGGFDTATVTLNLRDGIVEGTAGDDLIDVDYLDDPEGDRIDNNDEILPGEGPQDDIVFAGDGNDTVIAGDGDDEVYGEDGDDTLFGNDGDDYLSGGEGNDVLFGGDGDDELDAGQGGDKLYGEDGNDLLQGGPGPDLLDGGAGDDDIRGGNSADVIIGGDGNDTVLGEDGDDIIDTSGGAPRPDLGYPGLFPADTDPNDDIDFVDGGDGDDTIFTGDDADTIIGGLGDDIIDGGIDADTIDGGEGDDRIVGGEGSDIIDGGAGDDTIFAGIDPALGLPDNLDIPDATDLVPNNGMDVVNGGDGNDTIFGADDDDILNGDAGDDYIDGGIDDDTITGGTGDDTIIGGEGADNQSGGDDADTFIVDNAEDGFGDVIDGGTGGDDNDTLNLTGAGPLRIINETLDADGDSTSGTIEFLDGVGGNVVGTLDFSEIENIVPCFTPGTSIATPRGEMLVEDLQVGDKVITRDNGIQEIRWIGAKRMDGRELQNSPHLQPVLIQKGSLGNGLPERDMLVSPNHRMLVNNDRVSLYFEENEVLVSAKHLVNPHEGVQSINSMGTTYIHFMFDNHEVVLSNGAWTESFQPGDYSLKGIGNAQRNEIFELFPELQGQKGREAYASARLTLKKHEARMLFK
ncbi:tandem-95 repeat protein [Litoreibacter sp.]|nr:tandem-95 repeat protein [Litoreibacter sp.]